jgi:hypothetical protein
MEENSVVVLSALLTEEEYGDRGVTGELKLNFNKSLLNLLSIFFVSISNFMKKKKKN